MQLFPGLCQDLVMNGLPLLLVAVLGGEANQYKISKSRRFLRIYVKRVLVPVPAQLLLVEMGYHHVVKLIEVHYAYNKREEAHQDPGQTTYV